MELGRNGVLENKPVDRYYPAILVPLFTGLAKSTRTIALVVGGLDNANGSNLTQGIGKDNVGHTNPGQVKVGLVSCPILVGFGRPDVPTFDFFCVRLFMVYPPERHILLCAFEA